MISYAPLWETLKAKGMSTYTLRRKMNVSSGTVDRLKHNRHVSTHTIDMLCNLIDCDVQDIMVQIRD